VTVFDRLWFGVLDLLIRLSYALYDFAHPRWVAAEERISWRVRKRWRM
jgi:hypothetical protein